MRLAGVYAITDEMLLSEDRLVPAVEAALAGGVKVIQYRAKRLDPERQLREAISLVRLCADYHVPLLINDDLDLCLQSGAAGVHLGQTDGDIALARRRLGEDAFIGASCHDSLDLALKAQSQGADYVAFGRFFPSRTKPSAPPADLSVLSRARTQLHIPVVAIGGINAENGAAALAAGADMLAVIHYLFAENDVADRARRLARLFETHTPG